MGSWSGHESMRITQAGPRGVQSEVVKRCRLFASGNVSMVGGRHIRGAFEGSASKLRSGDISFAMVVLGSVRVGLGYQAHTTCAHTHICLDEPEHEQAQAHTCTIGLFSPSVSTCSASFDEHASFTYGVLYHWRKTVRGLCLLRRPWSCTL